MVHMKRLAALTLTLAIVISLYACAQNETDSSSGKTSTARVIRDNLQIGLNADGRAALPVTNLDFGVDGTVKKFYASAGDMVKEGDLLAELDDTDYQLEITNAQNNLDRMQVAYEDAVNQYNYSLKQNEYNVESTRRDLDKGFDTYNYEMSIEEAKKTLERRKTELDDALKAAAEPFDDYTYRNKIADAEKTYNSKLSDYGNPFDDYSYQKQIDDAEKTLASRKTELADAKNSVYDDYNDMIKVNEAQTRLERARISLDGSLTAQQSYDDARWNLDKAWNDYYRNMETANENAQTKIKSAEEAVEKAENDLRRLYNDMDRDRGKSTDSTKQSLDDAETQLGRAKTDLERAEKQYYEDAETKVKNAQSALNDAENALAKAQNDLSRARSDYYNQRSNTQNTYNLQTMNLENHKNSTSAISNAQLNIDDAENKLKEALSKLEKTKIYAPKDGKIISVTLSEGEQARASSDSMPIFNLGTGSSSNSVMTLWDVTEIYLTANITEGDIVGLYEGMPIKVTIDSIGDASFSGYIHNIDSLPTTDMSSGITTYTVTCMLDEQNSDIRDGMNALIVFIKKERDNVLLVPNKAVFIEDNTQYVNVLKDDGSYEKREVVCALSNGSLTEVALGLDEGETVAVGAIK
ncbi:MAG: biotin/lipoyl-binding protein [Oscillospiraceae bacterium]|nr:biotin/lipoyl-binding protein [Oscillospiraceae bacterium]